MIPRIDLIPESSRRRLGKRRQIHLWASWMAAVVMLMTISTAALTIAEQRTLQEVTALRKLVQLDADQQRQAQLIQSDLDRLTVRIARHDRLAWPIGLGQVIRALGEVTPATITLKSIAATPRAASGKNSSRRAGGADRSYEVMYLEVAGVALDDIDVSQFVNGIESHPIFSGIVLDYARTTTLGERTLREFGLTCEIDLTARYSVAEGAPQ